MDTQYVTNREVLFDVCENPLGLIERVVPDENEVELSERSRRVV
jgi:hypothetical protein